MNYNDVKSWAFDVYTALEYDPMPAFSPGPATDAVVQKVSSGMIVFLSLGGGAGVTTEGLLDQPFLSVRTVGKQFDYDSAERLAKDLDNALMSIDQVSQMGSARVQPITRSGGGPAMILLDSANRYHFTCSYVVETASEWMRT